MMTQEGLNHFQWVQEPIKLPGPRIVLLYVADNQTVTRIYANTVRRVSRNGLIYANTVRHL